MAVSIYTGATESGKSYHVKMHVIPNFKRVVIFDPVACFDGELVATAPDDRKILEIFRKFRGKSDFRIVIRTNRTSNSEAVFNQVVELASALGRSIQVKDKNDRVQVVIDEASTSDIMSASYQSRALKNLVCRGRHDNVDSHLIAQNPMAIHNQIRSQATKFCSFYLNNAETVPILKSCFSAKFTWKISKLPQYWRMEWNDKDEIFVFDQNNRISEKLSGNSREIPKKKGKSDVT